MVRLLVAAALAFAIFWIAVLTFSALGGAAIVEVLVAAAIATGVGVVTYRRSGGRPAKSESTSATR